jgi:hypothetical protein
MAGGATTTGATRTGATCAGAGGTTTPGPVMIKLQSGPAACAAKPAVAKTAALAIFNKLSFFKFLLRCVVHKVVQKLAAIFKYALLPSL